MTYLVKANGKYLIGFFRGKPAFSMHPQIASRLSLVAAANAAIRASRAGKACEVIESGKL